MQDDPRSVLSIEYLCKGKDFVGRYGLQTGCEGGGTAKVTIIERL